MVKRYLLTGLFVGFLGVSSIVYAADTEVILEDNTASSGLSVKKSNGETIMRAGGDGNVGIGTTAPATFNGFGAPVLHMQGPDTSIVLEGTANTPGKYEIGVSSGNLRFHKTDGVEVMRLSNKGNVGIGTTSPGAFGLNKALHVAGPSHAGIVLEALGGTDRTAGIWTQDGDMYFEFGGDGVRMFINESGNVGIGTTNPQGTLDVNGTIFQRGSSLHADYVFETDYNLETIDEHSEFMWQEKHLKAIPKAKADNNGMEIVEVGSHRKGIVEELERRIYT